MTARTLIRLALQTIGVVAASAPMRDVEAADGLLALQGLVDSLRVHRLTIASIARTVYPVVLGTGTYTLGLTQVAPDWAGARPDVLDSAAVVDSNGYEYPLELLTDARYQEIQIKALEGFPSALYLNRTMPDALVTLWPVPTASTVASVALYTPTPMGIPTTLDDVLSLPPGAQEALLYGLCVRLAPPYGKPLDPAVTALAQEALGVWKRSNMREELLDIDPALMPRAAGYNWLTDTQ